jgi:zona occludens toxin
VTSRHGGVGRTIVLDRASAAKDHLPRFGPMPWSAPAYDKREVTADPQLYCLSPMAREDATGKWQDFRCTCLTEQGTAYEITQGECRTLARQGPVYNPYRQQQRENAGRPSESTPAPVAHADPAPAGTVVDYRPGSRGDVFPRSPGYDPGQTFTGPVSGL